MEKIGFIGLGIMGKPMAKNLVKAGYKLIVHDINKEPVKELVETGAEEGASPKEIAEKVDMIITMLPNSPEVKQVALENNGIIEGAKKGLIYVDMSSIAPLVAKEVSEKLGEKGVKMLDAPVSGGEPGAIKGLLSVMVGGPQDIFDKSKEILLKMGKNVVRVGDIGAGNTVKLANQIMVAVNIAGISEALVLGKKAGVDPNLLFEAVKGGLAGSAVLNAKAPLIMERKFDPGFKIKLHIKDLGNVMETAHKIGTPLPVTSLAMEVFQAVAVKDGAEKDHGYMVKFFEDLAGIEVTK
jgi:2-hydroxy-3-oxopropionate reductase